MQNIFKTFSFSSRPSGAVGPIGYGIAHNDILGVVRDRHSRNLRTSQWLSLSASSITRVPWLPPSHVGLNSNSHSYIKIIPNYEERNMWFCIVIHVVGRHSRTHALQPPGCKGKYLASKSCLLVPFMLHHVIPSRNHTLNCVHCCSYNYNFGSFGWLDRLHGTDAQFRDTAQRKRHRTLFGITPLSVTYPDDDQKDRRNGKKQDWDPEPINLTI